MKKNSASINSPLGKRKADCEGSPVGVSRLDVDKSYAGVGELLQQVINQNSQDAWEQIRQKIDYTYESLDLALTPLNGETGFIREIQSRLANGLKLLFKPNLVTPSNIDPQTHGPDLGSTACTEWPFVAALMRWFHDRAGIRYHQMSVGEAGSSVTALANLYSIINPEAKRITPEALMEGRSGDFYGGWGFYFVRRYLAGSMNPATGDDPMKGYEESVSGTYIPPGQASDRLMVYDLNRIYDDVNKGRACAIPDGENYKSITLHKAIVGGDPNDMEDLKAYPGCILINIPKLKVHAYALLTVAIKNLGIGLYPMQFAASGDQQWDYSFPHGTTVTGSKARIPHEVWVPEIDARLGLPKLGPQGECMVRKTGGLPATMIDIVKAVLDQGIYMMHIVDAIQATNFEHTGTSIAAKTSEGMVFAGLNPVAIDLLCARYMFSNVPMKAAVQVDLEDGHGGRFPQEVPIAAVVEKNIVSKKGFDCPLARDKCFHRAEKRGLGIRQYYAIGGDALTGGQLISLEGHLGVVHQNHFSDIITKTLFYAAYKMPWDLQKTAFSYMEAVDQLEGSTVKDDFLAALDEDGDGVLTYDEIGKKGICAIQLHMGGDFVSETAKEELGYLKSPFTFASRFYKASDPKMNTHGYDATREYFLATDCNVAFQISQLDMEIPDPFIPGLVCGKGKWPSLKFARFMQTGFMLYGQEFPAAVAAPGLYASALFYADLTQNGGQYAGKLRNTPDPAAPARYISDVTDGRQAPLDFTIYVPNGFETLSGKALPNVEATDDPVKIFTASFYGGKELWPEIVL